ncbi:MAG: ATP-binding cassette domain-containing protein, partial [Bacteroidetes bacterium]|nr:ATP-binding cassette domain-containing protein [Bacteroidota bacterium]
MLDSIKKIYNLLPKKDHYKIALLFFLMILASLIELLGVGMVPAFIISVADSNVVFDTPYVGEALNYIGITTSRDLVIFGAIALIVIYIFKNIYLLIFNYWKSLFIKNRGVYLQNRIFKAYLTAPYTFYIQQNSSILLRNVTGEVGKIISGTLTPLLDVSLKILMSIFIVGALLIFEPFITVVTIIVLGGGGYLFLKITRIKMNEAGTRDREARGDKNKAVLQGLGAFKDTRVLNREKLFLKQYDKFAKISVKANIYRSIISSLPKHIIEVLMVSGILAITLIMVLEGRPFSVIIPILTLFGVSAIKLMPIFSTVIKEVNNMRYNSASVYAITDDLKLLENDYKDFREKILNDTNRIELNNQIELKNVSFSYPNSSEQAINDVSITIPKGKAVAFVGSSGAGKTTLVDLILGLLEPQKGTLEVDGYDVNKNIRGWMKNIGYIPQSIYLLDDRIWKNIAFGIPRSEVNAVKLRQAIKAAQLEEIIGRLPKGLQTKIGDRGMRLSGGQQQRVGIARALYNNPQVLVMDEATSALDNITEKFVIDAIEHLRGDRTIIMIAHRLTTVRNCDVIYMM